MTTKLPKLVREIVEMEPILKAYIFEAIEDSVHEISAGLC
jgi:hypothetical protein